ncbi:pyridoxamine 5'-phosphate oxidase family protein [Streptomyces sp. NPDC050560]|uniref:pyridoxamine 5'-phosphate oxidase family protein n=1 Tax=Streptomyces sp. NPDC050560 TaxID=3365630 RepID=UPI00379EAEA1
MSDPTAYTPTARTVPTRSGDRASYDRALVHRVLDANWLCHLGFVRDGAPVVLPTLFARVGERLYLHGSSASRPVAGARGGADGIAACVTVTQVDGVVLARSAFHHSVNYHSVVVHGRARLVTDAAEKRAALDAVVDHVVRGRAADSRPPTAKELAATGVLALDLAEVSAKVRTGGPDDDAADLGLPHWAGVLPVRGGYGAPVPSDDLADGTPLPAYLTPGG